MNYNHVIAGSSRCGTEGFGREGQVWNSFTFARYPTYTIAPVQLQLYNSIRPFVDPLIIFIFPFSFLAFIYYCIVVTMGGSKAVSFRLFSLFVGIRRRPPF
jgi:hypothetical protein